MKKYFKVSFEYCEGVYCSNIAYAETKEDVEAYYNKYAWRSVSDCAEWELNEAKAKGMPVITIDHTTEESTTDTTTTETKEDENMKTTNTNTREEITARIIDHLTENPDTLTEVLEDLDGWNGYLGDDRYYPMEELNELYAGVEPEEVLRRAFYGYDEDTLHTDSHGEREYGPFNPNREYFTFNGYGNLVSSDSRDYSGHLDRYLIEALEENRGHLYSIKEDDELSELLDELESAEG